MLIVATLEGSNVKFPLISLNGTSFVVNKISKLASLVISNGFRLMSDISRVSSLDINRNVFPSELDINDTFETFSTGWNIFLSVVSSTNPNPNCPELFLPQDISVPFSSNITVCSTKVETCITLDISGTVWNVFLSLVSPNPSCP